MIRYRSEEDRTQMKQQKRIDYLKAFAIILVVFYHALFQLKLSYSSMPYLCLTITLEAVHVPLFLLIAGYLCHRQPIRTFYYKKFRRILIPFLFMSVLKLIFNNLLSTEYLHGEGIGAQLFDAFLCGGLYWFCYCLLILFAAAPLLWNRKALKWILLVILIGGNWYLGARSIQLTSILQIRNVIHYSPYFLLGMLLSEHRIFRPPGTKEPADPAAGRTAKWSAAKSMILTAALLVGMVCGYLRFSLDVGEVYPVDLLIGLSVMYLLYAITHLIPGGKMAGAILGSLGKYSYQIMLLDPFLRVLFSRILSRYLPVGIISLFLLTVLDLLFCCLISLAVSKIPVLRVLLGVDQVRRG
ncbi:MAG: acyltransferase [Parasporobacterium sp.]|nr:acyltransferase [Parasporobacterium sp.]